MLGLGHEAQWGRRSWADAPKVGLRAAITAARIAIDMISKGTSPAFTIPNFLNSSDSRALSWLADGQQLATAGEVIELWSAAPSTNSAPLQKLAGHAKPITALAGAMTGEPQLVSADEDARHWWRHKEIAEYVVLEAAKLAFYVAGGRFVMSR